MLMDYLRECVLAPHTRTSTKYPHATLCRHSFPSLVPVIASFVYNAPETQPKLVQMFKYIKYPAEV